jgi:hypothetical protein
VRRVAALGLRVGGTLCMPPLAAATRSCGGGGGKAQTFDWWKMRVTDSLLEYGIAATWVR